MAAKAFLDLLVNKTAFNAAVQSAERTAQNLQGTFNHVAAAARNLLLIGAGAGTAGWIVKEASEAEQATLRLNAALEANGESAAEWSSKLQQAAAALQRTTVHEGDFLVGLMATASGMGVAADQLETVVRQAIALSAATGGKMDIETALKGAINATQGHYEALQRYIPALKSATTEQGKAAAYAALVARGMQIAQKDTETFAGGFAQLRNLIGDVTEELGNALLPSIKSLTAAVREYLPSIIAAVREHSGLIMTFAAVAAGGLALLIVLPQIVAGMALIGGAASGAVRGIVALTAALRALTVTNVSETLGNLVVRIVHLARGVDALSPKLAALAGAAFNPITLAAVALTAAIAAAIYEVARMQAQLEKTQASSKRAADALTALRDARAASASASSVDERVVALEKQRDALKALADEEQQHAKDLAGSKWGFNPNSDVNKAIDRNIEEAEERARKYRDMALETEQQIANGQKEIRDRAARQRAQDEFENSPERKAMKLGQEAVKDAERQLDLVGATAAQAKDRELAEKGVSQEVRDQVVAMIEQAEKRKEAIDLARRARDEAVQAARALADEAARALGVDPTQLQREKLVKSGAGRDELAAFDAASRAAAAAREGSGFDEQIKKLKEMATTQEELNAKTKAWADFARANNMISQEDYDLIMKKLAADQQRAQVRRVENSAAMFARIQDAALNASAQAKTQGVSQSRIDAAYQQALAEAKRGADASKDAAKELARANQWLEMIERKTGGPARYG